MYRGCQLITKTTKDSLINLFCKLVVADSCNHAEPALYLQYQEKTKTISVIITLGSLELASNRETIFSVGFKLEP
jgi:hypothetical protein